jgi:hypothetical protein
MSDLDETLTYEQILRRFEKIFDRKMTPQGKERILFGCPSGKTLNPRRKVNSVFAR